jgi:hypothetical protein
MREDKEKIRDLLTEDEKFHVELTEDQIAITCVSLQEEIEDFREILNNYEMLHENEKLLSKEKLERMITNRKIIIENLTHTHYPTFEKLM